LIIFSFSFQKGYISKWLSNRWLVILGEISFAFYLIHQLVLRTYGLADKDWRAANPALLVSVLLLVVLVLSYLAHYYVEVPANKALKFRLSSRRTPDDSKDRTPVPVE
jgi:peptidoglycan/LPS O-acetylase OafA/YrhL